jgi:hypothetical protein
MKKARKPYSKKPYIAESVLLFGVSDEYIDMLIRRIEHLRTLELLEQKRFGFWKDNKGRTGRPAIVTLRDKIKIFLIRMSNSTKFVKIATDFGLHPSYISKIFYEINDLLWKYGIITLEQKELIEKLTKEAELIIGDGTKIPIEAPVRYKKRYFDGYKWMHCVSLVFLIEGRSKIIIELDTSIGSRHDVAIAKRIFKKKYMKYSKAEAIVLDKGFDGLQSFGENILIAMKKPKNKELPKEEHIKNKAISKKRIIIEDIIRRLKFFKVLKRSVRGLKKIYCKVIHNVVEIYNSNRLLQVFGSKFA